MTVLYYSTELGAQDCSSPEEGLISLPQRNYGLGAGGAPVSPLRTGCILAVFLSKHLAEPLAYGR